MWPSPCWLIHSPSQFHPLAAHNIITQWLSHRDHNHFHFAAPSLLVAGFSSLYLTVPLQSVQFWAPWLPSYLRPPSSCNLQPNRWHCRPWCATLGSCRRVAYLTKPRERANWTSSRTVAAGPLPWITRVSEPYGLEWTTPNLNWLITPSLPDQYSKTHTPNKSH